jgi:hypothetical protein
MDKNYDYAVKVEIIPKFHTLYNYIDIIRKQPTLVDKPAEKTESMESQLLECEKSYVSSFSQATQKSADSFYTKNKEVNETIFKLNKVKRKFNYYLILK